MIIVCPIAIAYSMDRLYQKLRYGEELQRVPSLSRHFTGARAGIRLRGGVNRGPKGRSSRPDGTRFEAR